MIGFQSEQLFQKIVEKRKPERLFILASDDVISVRIQTSSLYSRTALTLIIGTLSAQFKFNNNVERWNWQSWFIYGRITAAAGIFSANTAGAAGKSHF